MASDLMKTSRSEEIKVDGREKAYLSANKLSLQTVYVCPATHLILNYRGEFDVPGFFGYLIAHDAHHRGQITMLASQVGHPIPQKATFGMWEWGVR